MFITLISAGNGGKAKIEPTERRNVSGDPPHGEFTVAFSRLVHVFAVVFKKRYTVNTVDSLES